MSSLISIEMLAEPAEMVTAQALFQRVWGTDAVQLDAATLRAFAHTGNYVAGAFSAENPDEPGEMVGCAVGFFAPPNQRSLHSHITGVDPRFAGLGIGTALKNHQRAWCLEQGVTAMTWTFDPAIARNAYFNITKLGVTVVGYLADFYGTLDDGLNAGSPSDRLLVRWDLAEAEPRPLAQPAGSFVLAADAVGAPVIRSVEPSRSSRLVQVPPDIEALRRTHPELAAAWRLALREALAPHLNGGGWRVANFLTHGCYLLERT